MCSNGTCARFNSKLVRLKVTDRQGLPEWLDGFNSKLVRLKVSGDIKALKTQMEFQFQTGSIKSFKEAGLRKQGFNLMFQFQTGSIKSELQL